MRRAASTVDDYLDQLTPEERTALAGLRGVVREAAPQAQESMRMGMPTYDLGGEYLVALAAQKNHRCLYFCNVLLVDQHRPQFERASLGRGCIRFKRLEDLPLPVVRRMIELEVRRLGGETISYEKDGHALYFPRLIEKLGFRPGDTVCLGGEVPAWYRDNLARTEVRAVAHPPASWAHLFASWEKDLAAALNGLDLEGIGKALWVSWPKKAAKVPTDLTEQRLRDLVLPRGWVDIKVAAVDPTWSALKFTRRTQAPASP